METPIICQRGVTDMSH